MSLVNVLCGAPTDSSVRVAAKVTGSSTRLAVADNPGMTGPAFYGPVAPSAEGIASLTATGLDADAQWYYRVEDDSVLDTSITGRFRTHRPAGEPFSFTVAAGACAGLNSDFPGPVGTLAPSRISDHPIFADAADLAPLLTIHMGDFHYYNLGSDGFGIVGGQSLANCRQAIDDVLACSNQQALYAAAPLVYVWDDHCYGINDSDGTNPTKANIAQVYRERVPSYPLAEASGSIYHDFQVGRVHFVCLDSRYNRDAPGAAAPRTYLGASQLSWLENILATSTAELIVLVSPQPIHSNGGNSWGSYTEERDQIYQMIADNNRLGKLCMIAGDQHQLGFDSGSHTNGFPVYTMAAFDSTSAGAALAYDIGVVTGPGHMGTLTFDDGGEAIRVNPDGWEWS